MHHIKATRVFAQLDAEPETEPELVANALRCLSEHYFDTRKGLSMKGVGGAPDWAGHETALFELSEQLRSWLRKCRHLRGSNVVMDRVQWIVEDPRFAKGRQSFVLLLGDFGDASHCEVLGNLLSDPDVVGHAIKAVTKLRVAGFSGPIERIATHTKMAWIKAAARKYLEKASTFS